MTNVGRGGKMNKAFNLAVKLREFAKENEILVRFEELKEQIREDQEKRKEKINYLFAFKTKKLLSETLMDYKKKHLKNQTK